MRIFAISDLHGLPRNTRAAVRWAKELEPDAVVLAGDILRPMEGAPTLEGRFREYAQRLAEEFDPIPCPVYYIMGNDDLIDWDPPQERFRSIHGRRIEQDGWNFVGYEYSLPFVGTDYEKPEEKVAVDLEALRPLIDERTVLVTHMPVDGIHDLKESIGPTGSPSLGKLIRDRRPRAHIHGHIHSTFGRTGVHFNVACREMARGMLIDLEDLTHEVVSTE